MTSVPLPVVHSSGASDLSDEVHESRQVISAEQRPAGGNRQEWLSRAKARPGCRKPLCPLRADFEVEVLAFVATTTIDYLERLPVQWMERVRHPCSMCFIRPSMCSLRSFPTERRI